jgi:ethanolamine phosphate phosphodiesterase
MKPRIGQPGRKLITTLPGNHDLGFGKGVHRAVRNRFNTYFGEGNRIDIIGNHTFVSVDSVSLSALDQRASAEEGVWESTQEFLDNAKTFKRRAVIQTLRHQRGLNPNPLYKHRVVETEGLAEDLLPNFESNVTEFPTVLLSHVPLFRAPGTPCGPLREHWPPSPPPKGQNEPLENDERNAIAVRGGYQYQNVLSPEISKTITEKIGDISYAFSGDDHDYCEVVHRGYPSSGGGIREITVKSLSWAMGIRKPGFVMMSLWNPVDEKGNPLDKSTSSGGGIQTQLCLMPDQLSLFIRYATLLVITIFVLACRALLISAGVLKSRVNSGSESPILPISEQASSAETEKAALRHSRPGSEDTTAFRASTRAVQKIQNGAARTRNGSPAGIPTAGYGLPATQSRFPVPLVQHAGYFGPGEGKYETEQWPTSSSKTKARPRRLTGISLAWAEFKRSIIWVGVVALIWYIWLIRNG